MRRFLAIMILSLGLQPLPADACDMEQSALPMQHAGHAGMDHQADLPDSAADCCAEPGTDEAMDCHGQLDCTRCPAGAPALVVPAMALESDLPALEPAFLADQLPHPANTPHFRPPIS